MESAEFTREYRFADHFMPPIMCRSNCCFFCKGGGEWISNSDYIEGLSEEPDELGWVAWNPKEIWIPNKKGLGMGKVFDIGNELYGKEMWRY